MRNIFASVAAVCPWLAFYIIFDVFYDFRHSALRLSDIKELRGLLDFSPLMFMSLTITLLTVLTPPILLLVANIRSGRSSLRMLVLKLAAVPVILSLIFTPAISSTYQERFLKFIEWSDYENIIENGRLAAFVYYSNLSHTTTEKLATLAAKPMGNPLLVKTTKWKRRNVHIVVLESFMDPRYLEQIRFSTNPLYEKLPRILGDAHFNIAISPVYGGDTAQAEFEILCGAPGLREIETVEFNSFNGGRVNSLITTLEQYGYASVATIASEPIYFNAIHAYQSLGFDDVHFVGTDNIYHVIGDDDYIFDGDLLEQNLEYIHSRYLAAHKPVINYILGLYGHLPYERDLKRHPDVLRARVNGRPSENINALANQFYYRTRAIYDFLIKLRRIDPDSIVLIIGDHLPPVLNKEVLYTLDEDNNIFVLFNGRVRYTRSHHMHYYQFPYLIMSLLSGTKVKVPHGQDLEDLYYNILITGNKTDNQAPTRSR
jgi:phosphoglycerol transferase MdoB-like AlkP superfamily enzyme